MREGLTVSPILKLQTHGYQLTIFHEAFHGLREFRTLLLKILSFSLTYNILFFIKEFDMIKPL
jgi:hypothetical protein